MSIAKNIFVLHKNRYSRSWSVLPYTYCGSGWTACTIDDDGEDNCTMKGGDYLWAKTPDQRDAKNLNAFMLKSIVADPSVEFYRFSRAWLKKMGLVGKAQKLEPDNWPRFVTADMLTQLRCTR